MIDLNITNFNDEINQGLVLVDFWAPWCTPCKTMEPTLVKLEESGVKIGKVNVDKNVVISKLYSVKGIPTLLIFNDGKLVQRYVGVKPYNTIKEFIDSLKSPKN